MDISDSLMVLALSILSGGATFLGVFLGQALNRRIGITFGVSFAAGIMTLIAIFELVPASLHSGSTAFTILGLLIGGSGLWLANALFPHLHTAKEYVQRKSAGGVRLAYLVAVGLVLHDFPEGFAIPSSFSHEHALGLLVVVATMVHNIPEGYILTAANVSSSQASVFSYKSAFYSTLSTVSGALLGMALLKYFSFLNPLLLSAAAGAMLFIALHELVPYVRGMGWGKGQLAGFGAAGVIYVFLAILL